jgi:hypothetical protein
VGSGPESYGVEYVDLIQIPFEESTKWKTFNYVLNYKSKWETIMEEH